MKPDHFRKKYHFLFQKELEEDQQELEEDQQELERKVDRHISYLERETKAVEDKISHIRKALEEIKPDLRSNPRRKRKRSFDEAYVLLLRLEHEASFGKYKIDSKQVEKEIEKIRREVKREIKEVLPEGAGSIELKDRLVSLNYRINRYKRSVVTHVKLRKEIEKSI